MSTLRERIKIALTATPGLSASMYRPIVDSLEAQGLLNDANKFTVSAASMTRLERVEAAMASRGLAAVSRQVEGGLSRIGLTVEAACDVTKLNAAMTAAGMSAIDRMALKQMCAIIGIID